MGNHIPSPEVIRLSTEMDSVKQDVSALASTLRDVSVRIDQKFEDIMKTLDRRANTGKQNTLTIIGIILPVVLALGGILWALVDDVDDRVSALTEVHLQTRYDSGYQAAKIEAAGDRVTEMLRRVERLEAYKMGE